jgi:hypothetical protein
MKPNITTSHVEEKVQITEGQTPQKRGRYCNAGSSLPVPNDGEDVFVVLTCGLAKIGVGFRGQLGRFKRQRHVRIAACLGFLDPAGANFCAIGDDAVGGRRVVDRCDGLDGDRRVDREGAQMAFERTVVLLGDETDGSHDVSP